MHLWKSLDNDQFQFKTLTANKLNLNLFNWCVLDKVSTDSKEKSIYPLKFFAAVSWGPYFPQTLLTHWLKLLRTQITVFFWTQINLAAVGSEGHFLSADWTLHQVTTAKVQHMSAVYGVYLASSLLRNKLQAQKKRTFRSAKMWWLFLIIWGVYEDHKSEQHPLQMNLSTGRCCELVPFCAQSLLLSVSQWSSWHRLLPLLQQRSREPLSHSLQWSWKLWASFTSLPALWSQPSCHELLFQLLSSLTGINCVGTLETSLCMVWAGQAMLSRTSGELSW